ncbi:MAG: glycosyltransferase family 2 protein [Planctomycetota bacterium]
MDSEALKTPKTPRFSLVIPFYNEEANVDPLIDELLEVLPRLGAYEVLAIDDGSSDRTMHRLEARRQDMPELRVLSLRENRGQSTAVCAGIDHATSPLILMLDGDRQNDPHDLPRLLDELGRVDGVSGIRESRQDSLVRRLSSRVANQIRDWISGDRVKDSASGIKGFRAGVLRRIPRFNGMHRFMPTLARMAGAKVVEIPVNHRCRVAGRAKYGVGNRMLRAFVDLLAVRWMRKRQIRYELRDPEARR